MKKDSPICVLGMGFVGLTLATKLSQSRKVYGLEINKSVREVLLQGKAHFFEPGLDELISSAVASGMLNVVESVELVPPEVKDFVITVGTPLRNGEVDVSFIDRAVTEIAGLVDDNSLVIMRSTVALGVTRSRVLDFYNSLGKYPGVAMCPERTVEGRALIELESLPQVIGASDSVAQTRAEDFFSVLGCPIRVVSSMEAAESVKLVANTFRDLTFAFANEIAIYAQSTDLDAFEIIAASNQGYPRSSIPLPGLTGGPCLEKDPWIFASSAASIGVDLKITKAARQTNEEVIPNTLSRLIEAYNSSDNSKSGIVVAGLAFKGRPATSDVRGTLAKDLRNILRDSIPGAEIFWFDTLVSAADAEQLGFLGSGDLEAGMKESRLLIVQNNNEEMLQAVTSYLSHNPGWDGQIFDFSGALNLGTDSDKSVLRLGSGGEI